MGGINWGYVIPIIIFLTAGLFFGVFPCMQSSGYSQEEEKMEDVEMTKIQAMKLIRKARRNVERETSDIRSQSDSIYSRGLSGEGYAGGYRDALDDVVLLLNGVIPSRRDYWEQGL